MQNFKGFINVIKQEMIIQLVRLNFFLKKKISKAGFGFNITLSKDCGRNYCLEEKKILPIVKGILKKLL